jgi:hypothetical protein
MVWTSATNRPARRRRSSRVRPDVRGTLRALAVITMNKQAKSPKHKLSLNQETLRALTKDQLGNVAGGDYFSKISVCIFNPCTRQ